MTGLTGLVDTQIPERLSQRSDLVRLPSSTVVTGPAPVVRVEPVANDVRIQPDATGARHLPAGAAAAATGLAAAPSQELSAAARAIGAVLADLPAAAGPVRGAVPIAPNGSAASAEAMAHGLARALSLSGLFYESHLASFAAGLRDLQVLRLEPQARAATETRAEHAGAQRPPAAPPGPADAPARIEAGTMSPQVRALVAQQLDLLASGVFLWRGEAWPGVPMTWAVEEDRERAEDDAAPHLRRWSTSVCLDMADLGAVAVRLTLAGRVLTACVTADVHAIARLRPAATDLQLQMSAIGLELPQVALVEGASP